MRCPRCGRDTRTVDRCDACGTTLANHLDPQAVTQLLASAPSAALTEDPELTKLTPVPPDPDARPADSPLAPGQTFGPRYRITNLLGVGGMGAVYRARDAELGIDVALKVIRPEATADPITGALLEQRFKRELLLAREVTHKNVVRILP